MKLLFLYGPPASGKLTIAEKLSAATGIPLFHNHLSRDLVKDIYKERIREHYDLVDQIRYNVLDYCSKHQTDLIFTYVYEGADDDADIKQFTEIVENNQGEVLFVELTADREDLIKRANNESRKRYSKLTDQVKMAKITKNMDIYSIPFVNPLKLNTSRLDPDTAVGRIVEEFQLGIPTKS
jgi:adenylate kinase family enzyme